MVTRNLNRHSSLGRWAQGASHGFRLKVSLLTATRPGLIRPPGARSKPRTGAQDSRTVPEHGTVGRALHSAKSGQWELRWLPSVVLVRRIVVVPVGGLQVVRVVVPRPAAQTTRCSRFCFLLPRSNPRGKDRAPQVVTLCVLDMTNPRPHRLGNR